MKKWGFILIVVALIAMLGFVIQGSGMLTSAKANETGIQPTAAVWPPVAKLHSKTSLVIMGSGFEPGQEMYVLLPAGNGSVSNIVDALKPAPEAGRGITADGRGNFAYLFTFGRLERVGVEGVVDITITDTDYNTLTTTPVGIADPDGRSRLGVYPRKAPDYVKNPDDIRPAEWAAPFFEYPERP